MRGDFSNSAPFVVENGSAIFFSGDDKKVLGRTRDEINEVLNGLRSQYRFTSFLDLGLGGIIEHTGLPESSARLAGEREFSEPLVWQDDEKNLASFREAVAEQGLETLEGGRFLHILGKTDKGRALALLRDHFSAECVIALGDSPNDIAMLEEADIACVIKTKRSEPLPVMAPRVLRSTLHGPAGWAELMTPLLDEIFPEKTH